MGLNESLPRFALIIRELREIERLPASQLVRTMLDAGHVMTTKGLKQDVDRMRELFGIDLRFDPGENSYYLEDKDETSADKVLDFLGMMSVNEVLGNRVLSPEQTSEMISFENDGLWAGARWLETLLQAVKDRHWVGFDYRKFESDSVKHYSLQPLLLKQYQSRWYLIGRQNDGTERTFGIDRIEKLKVRDETFEPPAGNPNDRFRHVVGLNYSRGKVETVRIACDRIQAQYLKTLPLHKSQKIIRDGHLETVFEMKVIPNYEFIQRILMMGAHARVLQPASLATEVYSHLSEAAKRYGD